MDYKEKKNKAFEYIRSMAHGQEDPTVKLLKGGSYKIKGYYLENNNLNDIRGASVNLSYVEDMVIPEIIREKYCDECIIYNGGGNIFCILPKEADEDEEADEDFALELERAAQRYLISASTAYVIMDAHLSVIEKNYKKAMSALEQKLSERKKLKLSIDLEPMSDFVAQGFIPWDNEKIVLSATPIREKVICDLCRIRTAGYSMEDKGAKKQYNVCAACLHKHRIGVSAKNTKYLTEYNKYMNDNGYDLTARHCNTLSEIDNDYVAVVYGDGNNMGQIIMNIEKIEDMMEFSDSVKNASNEAVFKTMGEMGIQRFQIVGLGGDDVFIIISGRVAIEFAVRLINNYNSRFEKTEEERNKNPYKSTMSVGVCIAKTNTPVRIMLSAAEDKLSQAKELARKDNIAGCDAGSLAFVVLDDPGASVENDAVNKFGAHTTMQPYSYQAAQEIVKTVRKLKGDDIRTRIRNIYDAYCNSDVAEEAELFFNYQNARNEKKISLPQINGFTLNGGLYERGGEKAFIWKDIIDLYGFVEEKERGK